MECVILIGVQGAGKTSFFKERFFTTHVRISLDLLKNRQRQQKSLAACLDADQRFVIVLSTFGSRFVIGMSLRNCPCYAPVSRFRLIRGKRSRMRFEKVLACLNAPVRSR